MTLTLTLFLLLLCRHASSSHDEVRSLLEFRKGIKSDPSDRVFSSWVLPPDASACPDSFYGVFCDASTSSVVSVSLDGLGLSGDLKFSNLIPLQFLRNLTLAGNWLTGRLVPTIGVMSSLQVIDLSGNHFYGPIPSRLNDLWALHHLNLSNNNFSGWLPAGLRNLQQLKVLDLHSNQLQGGVEEVIPELRNLEYVDFSRNKLVGSLELSVENASSLANTVKYVNLSGNNLGGRLWGDDTMGLFRNLQVLDLGDNVIVGELPEFGQLPNLCTLRLGNNQLSGSIPGVLLQGPVPLVDLDLSMNNFSGPIPEINSTTLITLNLSSNSISGSLPPSLGNCLVVDLSRNLLSDDVSVMNKWNLNLEALDLSSNGLSGSLPNLTQFEKLTLLSTRNNLLEGSLPFALAPNLVTIDLSCNRFDGPIPHSFFASVTITNLNLSGNHLTGHILIEGSHTSELLVLPTIPPMEFLDLSSNALTGELPSNMGTWGRLKLINLSRNSLSGQIPSELSKLTVLEYLDLSHNSFNSQIPSRLPSSLKFFNVAYNNLSGQIPKDLDGFLDSSFFPGNDELEHHHHHSSSDNQVLDQRNNREHHRSKTSIKIATILACSAAAVMIAVVLFAYRQARFHDFHGFHGLSNRREVMVERCRHLSLFSFSNDHLLTSGQTEPRTEIIENKMPKDVCSSSAEPIATIQPFTNHPTTSGRKSSSPDSPVESSPRFIDKIEQSVTVNVYSPDRLAGDLLFLDNTFVFTAEELSRAPAEVLGRSSHGTLYKATLDNRHMLIVKWLRVGLVKNRKDFAKEMKRFSSIRHPNIVSLRAYYWGPKEQERLLVADYVSGDSLAMHLYGSTPRRYSPLSFNQRLTVAIDIARCLLFLHDRGVPHGNLKPTNVILAVPDYSIRLTDYGLHRLMTPVGIAEQILNLGALGYRAPELAAAARPGPSLKADVYAFGVILMELLTRRSAGDIISGQPGAVDLTDWVRSCDRDGRGMDCIDRDIVGHARAVDDILAVSLRCILPVNERPNMRQVLDELRPIS